MPQGPKTAVDLKKILSGAQLPALPQSAIRLLELSRDPDNGPAEFAVPIESDPGLTGQVLRFVNSSYFGFAREISSVKLAITLVGIRTIKNFSLWSAVFSLLPNPKCGPFDLKSLWQDSLRRALFSRAMGKLLGMKEAEEPFAAALLQDMGIPVLAKEAPSVYAKLISARDNGRVRLSAVEQHAFGWTHAEAAGMMARHWNLPEGFAVLIENHLSVEHWIEQPEEEPGKLAVAMSALLPAATDPAWHDRAQFEECYERICPAGGPSIEEMLAHVDRGFAEFAPVLKLSSPSKSLIDFHNEMEPAAT
ncbi:MAG: HDOD domain-containing protein [Planctomycetota bacterium]|jgi:HD-like signal output (HDOD) protein